MKKNLSLIIIFSTCYALFSTELEQVSQAFLRNQKKVQTLMARGTVTVKMLDSQGETKMEKKQELVIYMKQPDKFKLEIQKPQAITIVQKGNLLTQKRPTTSPNQPTHITAKVPAAADLFKKYFNYGLEEQLQKAQLISTQTVVEIDGKKYTVFRLQPLESAAKTKFKIDYYDLYFNDQKLLTKNVVFSNDREKMVTEIDYIQKENIWLAQKVTTTTFAQNNHIVNIIEYSSLDPNTQILAKEFDLR
jgi:outer membrane lipoprotein-sorting protein